MSQAMNGNVSPARLKELADSGYIPHYRIDGGEPLFAATETKKWISKNMLTKCAGMALPESLRVIVESEQPALSRPPRSISLLPHLKQMHHHNECPGIYFLCKGDDVVYVGQSIVPSARISTHAKDKSKSFDRAYAIACPESELNDLESAFITLLSPSQQGHYKNGDLVAAQRTRPIEEIFSAHGLQEALHAGCEG
jgi:hypothetical protein